MASWTNLTDAILTIGKPLTYVIARAWRDNAIAIAEGAVGAPRVLIPAAISTAETNTGKRLRPNGSGGVEWVDSLTPAGQSNGSSSGVSTVWLALGPEGGTYNFQGQGYSTSGATKSGCGFCIGKVVSAVGSITSFKTFGSVTINFGPSIFSATIDDNSTSTYVRITAGIVEVNVGSLCRSGAFDTAALVNWIRVS